jgi:hypothetical protein
MLASKVVEGSMHRDQYLEFLEHQVISFSVCYENFLLILGSFRSALSRGFLMTPVKLP